MAGKCGKAVLLACDGATGKPVKDLQLRFLDNEVEITTPPTPLTNQKGETSINWVYPDDGQVHALKVIVEPEQAVGYITMASQPVTLKVGYETRLGLWVERDYSNTEHTLAGRLVSGSTGVREKTIKIAVNGAEYTEKTNLTGHFTLSLDLQPRNDQPTTYQIIASFEGDEPQAATAYATAPDGTQYAACTTTHYGFKPATNMTQLTVEPQATQTTTTTKTPEQLQKEAENSGWLKPPQPEFSIFYPWFRLHFIGQYNGETIIDVGVAVLSWADTGFFPDTQLKRKIDEWMGKIAWSIFVGVIVTETALWLASHAGLPYFAFVLLGYVGYKFLTLYANWNSLEGLWISLVSTFISTAISVWTGLSSFLPVALHTLAVSAANVKNLAFAFLCKLIMIPVNIYLLMMTWDRIISLGGV